MDNRKIQSKYSEDRPIKAKGQYDLNFIDWNNEWSRVYNTNHDFNNPEANQKSPIPGMSIEAFNKIISEEFERFEFEQEQNIAEQKCLGEENISKLQKMKMGSSSKDCTVCVKQFQKGEIIMKLPCKHIFHETCLLPWFKKESRCPNCRFDIKEHFSNQ